MSRFSLLFILFATMLQAFTADKDTLICSWSSNVGGLNPIMYFPNQMFERAA